MDERLHPAQVEAWRSMTPQQKIEQSLSMYWMARKLKAEHLRRQHPDWTDDRIRQAVREIFLYART